MQVVIDTNFIIASVKNKIQLFSELEKEFPEYKILVPIEVVRELEKIEQDKNISLKEREYAGLSIDLIEKKNATKIPLATKDVDAGIIRFVTQNKGSVVATLDRNLKERIKSKNPKIQFITIKEKSRISIQ